jgi:hypothetical protein
VNNEELLIALSSPDLQCYTVVLMALKDLRKGNISGAVARLRVDADKIRSHDVALYNYIIGCE